jgi:hypothetical protein
MTDEVACWRHFLNNTIGCLAWAVGIGSLALPHSQEFAALSLLFLGIVIAANPQKFPPTIRYLRGKKRTEMEDILLRGYESKYLGIRSIFTNFPVYWVGMLFLLLVATGVVYS